MSGGTLVRDLWEVTVRWDLMERDEGTLVPARWDRTAGMLAPARWDLSAKT